MNKMNVYVCSCSVCAEGFGWLWLTIKWSHDYCVTAFWMVTILLKLAEGPQWSWKYEWGSGLFVSSVLAPWAAKWLCALVSTTTRRICIIWWLNIGSQLSHVISIFGSPIEWYKSWATTFSTPNLHMRKFKFWDRKGTAQGQSMVEGRPTVPHVLS